MERGLWLLLFRSGEWLLRLCGVTAVCLCVRSGLLAGLALRASLSAGVIRMDETAMEVDRVSSVVPLFLESVLLLLPRTRSV